jgi:hypothetical protein
MEKISIATDFGASLVKAVYYGSSPDPSLVLLKPEVICVPSSAIEAYKNGIGFGSSRPEDTAWLKVGDEYYVLGESARHRFKVSAYLHQPKCHKVVYQCLAIIGIAIERERKIPSEVHLATLLPFDEFRYKEQFEEQLKEALNQFTFRGKQYSLKLNRFICLPEGSGLYLRGRTKKISQIPKNRQDLTTAIIMFGYRNISLMVMVQGVAKVKKTEMLGFAQMIELIKERVPVVNEQALIKAICQSFTTKDRKKALAVIAVSADPTMKKKEIGKLLKVIVDAEKEYFTAVTNFLNAHLNLFTVDEFIIGGGTAYYFINEIDKYLDSREGLVSWAETIERNIHCSFGQKVEQEDLQYRLCDVYGLLYFFLTRPLSDLK